MAAKKNQKRKRTRPPSNTSERPPIAPPTALPQPATAPDATPGAARFVQTDKVPYVNERGDVVGVTGFAIDITERQQAQAEIRRHAAELRVRNEEPARFNRAMVDREVRMIELKKQVNELYGRLGQPPRYRLDFEKTQP